MTTIKQLRNAAKKVGATIEYDTIGISNSCRVMAPKGFHWVDGPHELVDEAYKPWKPDYEDLLSRMSAGIEPCNNHSPCETYDPQTASCEWWGDI